MRYKTLVTLAVSALTVLPVAAQAQDKKVYVSLGGGATIPNSEVKDHLGNGYNFNFGVEVKVTPVIGIEGLYSFNGLGDKQISIPVSGTPGGATVATDFFGSMNMQYGTVNLVLQKPDGAVRPYGLVGMGVYYRPIKVTTPGVGYVPGYCDPWWYDCVPRRLRSCRERRGRAELDRLRDGLRRRPELRGVLRGTPLSLHLGSDRRRRQGQCSRCPASAPSGKPTDSFWPRRSAFAFRAAPFTAADPPPPRRRCSSRSSRNGTQPDHPDGRRFSLRYFGTITSSSRGSPPALPRRCGVLAGITSISPLRTREAPQKSASGQV